MGLGRGARVQGLDWRGGMGLGRGARVQGRRRPRGRLRECGAECEQRLSEARQLQ